MRDEEMTGLNSITKQTIRKQAKCEEILNVTRMNIIIVVSTYFSSRRLSKLSRSFNLAMSV